MKVSFIVAVNNEEVLKRNIKSSSVFLLNEFILQRGYINVPKAYNDAVQQSKGDLLCFVHQDVFLPKMWIDALYIAIKELDLNWGVLGVAGARMGKNREFLGYLQDRGKLWGSSIGLPANVQTIDELLLIRKKGDGLRFDEDIPSAHLYGADLCLQSQQKGRKCYIVNAFCHHNSTICKNPASFYVAVEYIKKKWKAWLPIATTCAIIREGKSVGI